MHTYLEEDALDAEGFVGVEGLRERETTSGNEKDEDILYFDAMKNLSL